MNGKTQQEALLIRNLLDAGCPQALIVQFTAQHSRRNTTEQIRLLTEHRSTILNSVHEEQAKLDCIDYLLFQLKKTTSSTH